MSMDSSDYDINDSATELEEEDVTELEEDFESAEQATVQALESFDNFLDEDDDFYSDEDEVFIFICFYLFIYHMFNGRIWKVSAMVEVEGTYVERPTLMVKDYRDGSEDGLTFGFRFIDATVSTPDQGKQQTAELISFVKGGGGGVPMYYKKGYGSVSVLPEQGIYLAASIYRPVLQFTDKIASMLPKMYSQLGNDGLLAFVENFVKDHFLPTMFVDYRKSVQQAISSPVAFRPRAHTVATYVSSVEKGRPVLQGLLAIDFLAKEASLSYNFLP
ncbi:hypothetical protein JRO89_XS14G0039900 [Xanthoceras sorbifolium]|uniref:Exocyst complex component Sec8 n=1 Tax=Xanthoceras sorbifolium TaxID=99658 RepID=A0ABQ8H3P0_9ROSI|nr:hypothetical protein JRO89_XS14G0039900 [Xanthoceras sorbifolium]